MTLYTDTAYFYDKQFDFTSLINIICSEEHEMSLILNINLIRFCQILIWDFVESVDLTANIFFCTASVCGQTIIIFYDNKKQWWNGYPKWDFWVPGISQKMGLRHVKHGFSSFSPIFSIFDDFLEMKPTECAVDL